MPSPDEIQALAQAWSDRTGLRVFPTKGKAPAISEDWRKAATLDAGAFHWGGATGYGVVLDGVTVVDIDDKQVTAKMPPLKRTLMVGTPRGFHVYYEHETRTRINSKLSVDLKAGGGAYVIGPGSNSETYRVLLDEPMTSIRDNPELLAWILPDEKKQGPVIEEGAVTRAGGRNDHLTRVGGLLRRYGFSETEIVSTLLERNRQICVPPLHDKEVRRIAESVSKYEPDPSSAQNLQVKVTRLSDRLLTAAQVSDLPEPEWIVEGLLAEAPVTVMYGRPGHFKSFLALDIAARVADGIPLPLDDGGGLDVKTRPVIYILAEGFGGMPKRVKAGGFQDSSLVFLPESPRLGEKDYVAQLRDLVSEHCQGGLLVIDTLQRASAGLDENSAKEMGLVMDNLSLLAEGTPPCSILVVHHSNRHNEEYRGSSAIEASCSTMLRVRAEPLRLEARVQSTKSRDTAEINLGATMEASMSSLAVRTYWRPLQ